MTMTPLIDPMTTLAVSMHATERGYALLLGSGVSRAAHIPTGWDVVLDLVRKLATAMGDSPSPSPTCGTPPSSAWRPGTRRF